jgi:DNA-binding NarL/FixJ family response regulator
VPYLSDDSVVVASPALPHRIKALLRCCAAERSTQTAVLARQLYLSEETVDTYFKIAKKTLGMRTRSDLLLYAVENRSTLGLNPKEAE